MPSSCLGHHTKLVFEVGCVRVHETKCSVTYFSHQGSGRNVHELCEWYNSDTIAPRVGSKVSADSQHKNPNVSGNVNPNVVQEQGFLGPLKRGLKQCNSRSNRWRSCRQLVLPTPVSETATEGLKCVVCGEWSKSPRPQLQSEFCLPSLVTKTKPLCIKYVKPIVQHFQSKVLSATTTFLLSLYLVVRVFSPRPLCRGETASTKYRVCTKPQPIWGIFLSGFAKLCPHLSSHGLVDMFMFCTLLGMFNN